MLANSEIAIIIVTYNPDWKIIKKNINELGGDCDIYISDNGSKNLNNKIKSKNVSVLENKYNLGIAEAQNIAIKQIKEKSKSEYIFFLDQDSFITLANLKLLLRDLKRIQKKNLVGCLAANPGYLKNKITQKRELISSGMLIPVESIKKIGLMKSNLFIDMVDYEWCWRATQKGFTLFEDERVTFKHQIGAEKKVLNKQVIAPFRLYYVFRNTLYLVNTVEYKSLKKEWMIRLYKQFIFNTLFCSEKKKRISFIYRGIKDAKRKKLGKLSL